jgi:hypothetical protein
MLLEQKIFLLKIFALSPTALCRLQRTHPLIPKQAYWQLKNILEILVLKQERCNVARVAVDEK